MQHAEGKNFQQPTLGKNCGFCFDLILEGHYAERYEKLKIEELKTLRLI